MEHFRGLPLLVLQLSGVVVDFMIMRLFWMWTKISEIWIRDQLEIVKGILGRTGVILYFGLDLEHFRRMRTIRSRRLRLVMNCFRMRFWPIRLFRFMRNCLCWHYKFSRMWGCMWFPLLAISLFDGLWTGWFGPGLGIFLANM